MSHRRPTVHWQVITEDAEWRKVAQRKHDLPQRTTPGKVLNVQRRHHLLIPIGLALFLLAAHLGGHFCWRIARLGLTAIEADLQEAIALETWAASTPPTQWVEVPYNEQQLQPGSEGRLSPQPSDNVAGKTPEVVLQGFEPRRGWILADVVVTDPSLPLAYRESRCYQQTDTGLQRTTVAPVFWGAEEVFESDFFIFVFHHRDLRSVVAATTHLDPLYVRLTETLGLPAPNRRGKIVVTVVNTELAKPELFFDASSPHIQIPSPTLLSIPLELSEVDVIVQSVSIPLVRYLTYRSMDTMSSTGQRWRPLFEALRLWLLWESDGPLAQWHSDIVTWLYGEPCTWEPLSLSARSTGYRQFCQVCSMLELTPLDLSIPLPCTQQMASTEAALCIYTTALPTELANLVAPLHCATSDGMGTLFCLFPPNIRTEATGSVERSLLDNSTIAEAVEIRRLLAYRAQVVVMSTMLEYATAVYGQESLPDLLQALDSHAQWETLIPAVYSVSAEAFEIGWQRYLQEHYGLSEIANGPFKLNSLMPVSVAGIEQTPMSASRRASGNILDQLALSETQVTISFGRCGHE